MTTPRRSNAILRPTYTANNAAKFVPLFRETIRRGEDTFFNEEILLSTNMLTMRQKANEAILWLTQEDLTEHTDKLGADIESQEHWLRFRRAIKFRPQIEDFDGNHNPGLWMLWKIPYRVAFSTKAKVVESISPEQLSAAVDKINEGVKPPPLAPEVKENPSDWKERVIGFINGADRILVINDLNLSVEDQTWVFDRIGAMNIEKIVRQNTIRLMRG